MTDISKLLAETLLLPRKKFVMAVTNPNGDGIKTELGYHCKLTAPVDVETIGNKKGLIQAQSEDVISTLKSHLAWEEKSGPVYQNEAEIMTPFSKQSVYSSNDTGVYGSLLAMDKLNASIAKDVFKNIGISCDKESAVLTPEDIRNLTLMSIKPKPAATKKSASLN